MRYLKHFKWHHLAEKANYERRVRALQLRNELLRARRAAERYVGHSEAARRMRAREREDGGGGGGGGGGDKGEAEGAEEEAGAAEAAERPRVKKRRRAVAAEGAQLPEQLAALPDAQLW